MKNRFLIILFVILSANAAFSASAPLSRYHVLFDRDWKFLLGDEKNAAGINFNDQAWRILDLPHDWSIEGEFKRDEPTGGGGGYLPTGIGWYRKQFTLPSAFRGKQVSIQFDGVYMNSEVWINGHLLGKRPSGYISFIYDLTPYLIAGKNTIAVKADNSNQPNSRWYSGSGIYRHVWLNATNATHIAPWGTYITTPEVSAGSASVSVETKIESKGLVAANTILISAITDEKGQEVATTTLPFTLAMKDSGK
jgi:beta-galactosidase